MLDEVPQLVKVGWGLNTRKYVIKGSKQDFSSVRKNFIRLIAENNASHSGVL